MIEAIAATPHNVTDALLAEVAPEPESNLAELGRKWGIYSPGELRLRAGRENGSTYVINGLFPERAIAIAVGESGIGKSPLLYQAALCVATGLPFLGYEVQQGRALYADFENGLGDVDQIITGLGRHLRLDEPPDDLLLWNLNDCPPKWTAAEGIAGMIRDARPRLAVIDSLGACFPEIEDTNSNATKVLQYLRSIGRDCGTTIVGVHHLRKPSRKLEEASPALEHAASPRKWFIQARGASALINGSDIRLGIAEPTSVGYVSPSANGTEEIALVWRGFGRVRGEIPTTFLARAISEDGEPLGYSRLTGARLLFNPDQEAAFGKLPDSFRFRDAQMTYGKGPQATTDFLNKCVHVGILDKPTNAQGYRKLGGAE